MPTSTTNYGFIKPGTDDPILIGQLNDNMDTIDTVLKDHSDKIDAAALGIKYKGEVNYYADLPNNAEIGDAYTVKYAGSSGTTPDGTEYVWGAVSGTNQWINFSKDSYTKAEVDALLSLKANIADIPTPSTAAPAMDGTAAAGTSTDYARADHVHPSDTSKQDALTAAQLAAANSGIDSAKVEQIETNKNNILSLTANAAITSIISDVTTATGFTLEAQSFLYKQGKHIFGRLIISSTNAYTTSDVEPCTIGTYKPSLHYVAFCGLGADKWKIKSIGYAYISSSSGVFKVNDSGDNSNYTANIPIDYVTA